MTTQPLHSIWFVNDFVCTGDSCPDTCCKGWGMQLSGQTVEKYKKDAPELLDAVTSGEAEHIMKRDPDTDYCIKFDAGWCGVHKQYGTDMLGDACHFFPRSTRMLGEIAVQSAALSCPEITKTLLFGDVGCFTEGNAERLPHSVRNMKPEGLNDARALDVHQIFLDAALDESHTPQHLLVLLRRIADKIEAATPDTLAVAIPFYLREAAGSLPPAMSQPANPLNILNTLNALFHASKATNRPRLMQTLNDMQRAMEVTLDHTQLTVQISENTQHALNALSLYDDAITLLMRRWLYGQFSLMCVPFAGLGDTMQDRITLLAVRFATVKLALQSLYALHNGAPEQDEITRVVQSLARFMDHLASAEGSLLLYEQCGWKDEAGLRGLLQ